MKSFTDTSIIDQSINDVSTVIGEQLNTSIDRELSQTDQQSKLDELHNDLRLREKTLADEKYNLAKIENELEDAKRKFKIEYNDTDRNLDRLIDEELAKQTKINDSFYMLDQKTGLIQEQSRATRAKLVEMNDLEMKLEQQRLHAETMIDKLKFVSNEPSIAQLQSQIQSIKDQIHDITKQIDDLRHKSTDSQRELTKTEKIKNDFEHHSKDLQMRIDSLITTHSVHVDSLRTQEKVSKETQKTASLKSNDLNDQKQDLFLDSERLSSLISQSELILNELESNGKITESNIVSKQNQIKHIKNDLKDMKNRLTKIRQERLNDKINKDKILRDLEDQVSETRQKIQENKDNVIHCNHQARRIEDSMKKTLVKIGQCVEDAAVLEHAKIRIDNQLEKLERKIEDRSTEIDLQIDELNELHRQIASAKFASKSLDRLNAIYFVPQTFDRDTEKMRQLFDAVEDSLDENKKIKKQIRLYERKLYYSGAECAIISNRQKQMYKAEDYVKKSLAKYGSIKLLEASISELKSKIESKKCMQQLKLRDKLQILNLINGEIDNWKTTKNRNVSDALHGWVDKIYYLLNH